MFRLISLLSLCFPLIATASAELPQHPCNGRDCSPSMHKMVEHFDQSLPIETLDQPTVFSGECYHAGYGYDSNKTQHGMILLDQIDNSDKIWFNGVFTFFYKENPYKDHNVEQARKVFPHLNKAHLVNSPQNISVADFSTDDTIWIYFIRQNPENGDLIILGCHGRRRHPSRPAAWRRPTRTD